MTQHQQIAVQIGSAERRIDDDEVVAPAQGVDQATGGSGLVAQVFQQVLLTGEHMQTFRDDLRRPLDEQFIDTLRRFQRGAQPRSGFRVQQQRAAAAVEVAVHQHGMAIRAFAEVPGQVDRDGAGADAAARSGHRDDATPLKGFRPVRAVEDDVTEVPRDHVARDGFEQVFLDAQDPGGVAVEVDVVEFADEQHLDVGFDDVGKVLERGQRPPVPADIYDQHAWGGVLAQHLDGASEIGTMELDAARCRVAQSVAQDILGFGIGDEGDDIFAIRAGRRLLGRDVGDGYVGRHH